MKRNIVLLLLLTLVMGHNYAIEVNGSIKLSGDSTFFESRMEIPLEFFSNNINFIKLQKKLIYKNTEGKRIKLKPGQVQQLRFNYNGENYVFECIVLCTPPPIKFREKLLLQKIISGELCYYRYYKKANVTVPMGGMTVSANESYYQDVLKFSNGEVIVVSWFNDFKSLSEYLVKCTSVVGKIENEIYKKSDIQDIVNEYNNCDRANNQ